VGMDTLAALSCAFTLADTLLLAGSQGRGGQLSYCPAALFGLFFLLHGTYHKRCALRLSCRTAAAAAEPYLVTLDEGKWNGKDTYAKWSGTPAGFGSQIQMDDGAQRIYRVFCPVLLLACIVFSLLASFGIFLLDYIIAFTVLGFGGIFRNRIKNKQLSLVCGILTVGLFRYIAHVISGAIFFGIWGEWFFTQEGFFAWGQTLVDMFPGQSLYVIYSLIYNLSFLLPEVVITAVVGFLITKAMPRLLDKKDMQ